MKSEAWKTYRTRFLVKAKQLSSSLSFVDHLGRQHCGRKGDYLVESSDGVLSIAPRRIFEDIYVPMSLRGPAGEIAIEDATRDRPKFEALVIEEVKLVKSPADRHRADPGAANPQEETGRRKLPQPCRVRPAPSGFGVM